MRWKKDGYRILINGIWPRGVTKDKAMVDAWLKEAAPSKQRRQWFAHDPEKFDEWKETYKQELHENMDHQKALDQLKASVRKPPQAGNPCICCEGRDV